jgi:hypothetical protein
MIVHMYRVLIGIAIALGWGIGGCAIGFGLGYTITGGTWNHSLGSFLVVVALAIVLGFVGLISGALAAIRHDGRTHPSTTNKNIESK